MTKNCIFSLMTSFVLVAAVSAGTFGPDQKAADELVRIRNFTLGREIAKSELEMKSFLNSIQRSDLFTGKRIYPILVIATEKGGSRLLLASGVDASKSGIIVAAAGGIAMQISISAAVAGGFEVKGILAVPGGRGGFSQDLRLSDAEMISIYSLDIEGVRYDVFVGGI